MYSNGCGKVYVARCLSLPGKKSLVIIVAVVRLFGEMAYSQRSEQVLAICRGCDAMLACGFWANSSCMGNMLGPIIFQTNKLIFGILSRKLKTLVLELNI